MSTTKAVFVILILLPLASIGCEGKSSKVQEGQMCTEESVSKEQCRGEATAMKMEGQMAEQKSVGKAECGRELSSVEVEVLRHIFQSVLKLGTTPTIKEMAISLNRSDKDVIRAIEELESKDHLLRKKGTQEIISIYPFSLTPTEHQIFLDDGRRLFAMCAVDALGMPIMFDRNVKIVSQCEECKQEITIEIKDEKIVSMSHPGIMIWSPRRRGARPAETCCPKVNFFCSNNHLKEWEAKNPNLARIGHGVQLEQAFPRIKECWKRYGEAIGIR